MVTKAHGVLKLSESQSLPATVDQPGEQVFQSFQELHNPLHGRHSTADMRHIYAASFCWQCTYTTSNQAEKKGRGELTLTQIFGGEL